MEKNRFDSSEPLWTTSTVVTTASKAEGKRMPGKMETERRETEYHYQYLYLEDPDEENDK